MLIENFMEHVSWIVSQPQTEIQRPHIEKIFTKIKNYGKGYTVDIDLYQDLCRLLSITISRHCFNLKKHLALYLNFSKGLR